MNPNETPATELRAWAKGIYPTEAATELLIRAGFAQAGRPWVFACDDPSMYGIDFQAIPDNIGYASGGERRLLTIAAAIGSSQVTVNLSDALPGLDRFYMGLVLAAVSHAAGTHEGRPTIVDPETRTFSFGEPYTAMYPWPKEEQK